eukprot:jgi/Botrbrau1/4628/Bobra.60_2s0111.1
MGTVASVDARVSIAMGFRSWSRLGPGWVEAGSGSRLDPDWVTDTRPGPAACSPMADAPLWLSTKCTLGDTTVLPGSRTLYPLVCGQYPTNIPASNCGPKDDTWCLACFTYAKHAQLRTWDKSGTEPVNSSNGGFSLPETGITLCKYAAVSIALHPPRDSHLPEHPTAMSWPSLSMFDSFSQQLHFADVSV